MKPTNINIAKYYGVTPEILSYYDNNKRGIEKKRMYDAMKEYYIKHEVLKDDNSSCFEHQVSEVLLKNNKGK